MYNKLKNICHHQLISERTSPSSGTTPNGRNKTKPISHHLSFRHGIDRPTEQRNITPKYVIYSLDLSARAPRESIFVLFFGRRFRITTVETIARRSVWATCDSITIFGKQVAADGLVNGPCILAFIHSFVSPQTKHLHAARVIH